MRVSRTYSKVSKRYSGTGRAMVTHLCERLLRRRRNILRLCNSHIGLYCCSEVSATLTMNSGNRRHCGGRPPASLASSAGLDYSFDGKACNSIADLLALQLGHYLLTFRLERGWFADVYLDDQIYL